MSEIEAPPAGSPKGTAALFFIQTFATLGFAVLYSTLVLYATKHLHFPAVEATAIMGVFGAFNYGLHMFGGYLGGRFLSNRNLFVGGMVPEPEGTTPAATNPVYFELFLWLGLGSTAVGIVLALLIPKLRWLITDRAPVAEG